MFEKSKFWYLKNINIFDGMDDSQMKMIEKMTTMSKIGKHSPIYFPDQPSNNIFFLKEGHVKLYRLHEDGREVILDILGPGEIFGELSIIEQGEGKDIAETLDDALVCSMKMQDFENMLMHNPLLNLQLTKWVGLRLRRFEEKLSELAFKDVTKRIISFLIRYADNFGKIKEGTIHVTSFLSHQEIAYLTAASRQTVTTVLNELKQKGMIEFTRKTLTIYKIASLRALAR